MSRDGGHDFTGTQGLKHKEKDITVNTFELDGLRVDIGKGGGLFSKITSETVHPI